ncbi:MAG: hypothetical protein CMR00_09285 [[Chlorobium] sp. 445]|nr:MAG: hypothetical protein CMR00_09285 [[Chlorobium] sp. 445]
MTPEPQPQQPFQLNIEIDEKMAEGTYSNFVLINHSPAEFVIDFTRVLPGIAKAKVSARIVMTPQHAKSFLLALQDNIQKYESAFGTIKIIGAPETSSQMGFRIDNKTKPS